MIYVALGEDEVRLQRVRIQDPLQREELQVQRGQHYYTV